MKSLIIAGLLTVLPISAHAQGDPQKCSLLGSIYETAAHARDLNHDPKMALDMVSPYKEIPVTEKKAIINRVYFEPEFQHAGGAPLRIQMMQLCLNGPSKVKPLQ